MSAIKKHLNQNKDTLHEVFTQCSDFTMLDFSIGEKQVPACLFFLREMVDKLVINRILQHLSNINSATHPNFNQFEWIKQNLELNEVTKSTELSSISDAILSGYTALLLEGYPECILIGSVGIEYRAISEPLAEGVIKGPREGFNESIKTNLSLIRKRLKTTRLKSEGFILGNLTKTETLIVYLEGAVSDSLLTEVKNRIQKIDADSILETQYIEEFIEDQPFSLFPQVETTERPDKAAASLLTGKVVILVDGTPFAIIAPVTLSQFLISSEDYYQRYPFALFIRTLRYLSASLSLLLPAIYISVTTFHQEMVPTPLMISIVNSYETVPFPVFVEALLLELTFEIIREAGIRLPRLIGQTISIVGALVIGQAAVQAGLASYGMVIVVSLTGIMSFVIPSYTIAIAFRLMRFVFMVLGATLGLYGVLLGMILLIMHLASLRSFGVPFLAPIAPVNLKAWKDTIARFPWWNLSKRANPQGNKNN